MRSAANAPVGELLTILVGRLWGRGACLPFAGWYWCDCGHLPYAHFQDLAETPVCCFCGAAMEPETVRHPWVLGGIG